MYIINRSGPRIDPWGTPVLIVRMGDDVPPIETNCDLSDKLLFNRFSDVFCTPKKDNFAAEFRDLTCQKLLTCLKTLMRTSRVLNLVVVVLCLLIQGKRILLNYVF